MTNPVPPIELTGTGTHFPPVAALPAGFADRLARLCPTVTEPAQVAEASRDWWPLAMHWSLQGQVPQLASVVAHPSSSEEVSGVVRLCVGEGVPLTAAGGRSGVVGGSVPVFGGVLLDLTAMQGLSLIHISEPTRPY